MHGWSSALVFATGLSGLFAFGLIQSAYAPQAQALFFVFAMVLVLVMLGNAFTREHGHALSERGKLLLGVVLGAAIIGYVWTSGDWTAERLGRNIDQGAAQVSGTVQTWWAKRS